MEQIATQPEEKKEETPSYCVKKLIRGVLYFENDIEVLCKNCGKKVKVKLSQGINHFIVDNPEYFLIGCESCQTNFQLKINFKKINIDIEVE